MSTPTPGSYGGAQGQQSSGPFDFAGSPLSSTLQQFFAQNPYIYEYQPARTTVDDTYEAHHEMRMIGGQQIAPPGIGLRTTYGGMGRFSYPMQETYTTPAQYAPTQEVSAVSDRSLGGGPTTIPAGPAKTSAEAYWQSWFHKDPAQIEELQRQLVALNYLNPGGFTAGRFDPKTQTALGYVLMNVAQYNDPNLTVSKYLSAADTGPGGKAPTTQTTTSHDTHTTFTSKADVAGQYQQIAEQLLGHRATQTAAEAAYEAIHGAEAANPQTSHTTTTTTYDALTGRQTAQNSSGTTTGGLGAAGTQDLLLQQAYAAPDFGAFQSAGPLYNALVAGVAAVNGAGKP